MFIRVDQSLLALAFTQPRIGEAAVRAFVLAPPHPLFPKLHNLKYTCVCPRKIYKYILPPLTPPNLKSRNPSTLVVRHNPLSFTISHNRSLPTHLPIFSQPNIPKPKYHKHTGRMKSFATFALLAASITSAQVT